ncbi:glutamate ABC transporter substrate-binding protein [Corynebacterium sp. CNCTC7651]|uniref:glutamate ABC transporter substrate-binding protein n=1 Tax=Corynebacterium TaxID=1716 RepID=UPI001F37DBEA|nr:MULTISPECIES: glutamate ABC transporter substrate-binding protein [Corynebacterium]UIZ91943.1 glutamate ABC transporter substrate-binding protein [Corynebacterium sp. CNCTC7651]
MKRLRVIGAAALAALAVVLGGCAPDAPPPVESEPPLTFRGAPMPANAKLDPPGVEPDGPFVGALEQGGDWQWPGSLPPGTEEDRDGPHMQRIISRGRIIVGVDQSQYLLSYRDPARGDLRGFEVDLAREVAQDIFGDPNKVDFRFVDSAARAETLQAGEVDIVIRTMSITPDRAEVVDFSTPYLTSYVRVLAPRDRGIAGPGDLAGKTVCVVDGTNLVNLVRNQMPDSSVLRTRTWSDCLMATQQFQADAVVGDDAVLVGMMAQDPLVEVFPEKLANQIYAVGVAKGHDDVVRQINLTIERIRTDGTWNRMFKEWLGGSVNESWLPRRMYRKEEEG